MHRSLTAAVAVAVLAAGASRAHAQQFYQPAPMYQPAPVVVQSPQLQLVGAWYIRYLGRGMDPGAIAWVRQLECGKPAPLVLSHILGSPEYFQKTGCNPVGFVASLYADVLSRPAAPQEIQSWLVRLGVCRQNRQRLALEFLQAASIELTSTLPQAPALLPPPMPQQPLQQPPPPQPFNPTGGVRLIKA